ncbi:Tyrosyl-DNA phosphodiesterase 2 [Durusdinium trenchii]
MLSELAKVPAVIEGEFKHNWGTAETLYKSEAIDSFGSKYLLGIFEKEEDAKKAFDVWNKEYEQAGKDVKENLKSWAKGQEAELAEEQDSVDRIRKALEEAQR